MVQKYLFYVKSMGSRVGGREFRYTHCQVHKMELFAEKVDGCFCKKLHLMFEMVLNTPLHHLKTQAIFQAKRKVAHPNITTKTSAMKVVFSEGTGRI